MSICRCSLATKPTARVVSPKRLPRSPDCRVRFSIDFQLLNQRADQRHNRDPLSWPYTDRSIPVPGALWLLRNPPVRPWSSECQLISLAFAPPGSTAFSSRQFSPLTPHSVPLWTKLLQQLHSSSAREWRTINNTLPPGCGQQRRPPEVEFGRHGRGNSTSTKPPASAPHHRTTIALFPYPSDFSSSPSGETASIQLFQAATKIPDCPRRREPESEIMYPDPFPSSCNFPLSTADSRPQTSLPADHDKHPHHDHIHTEI